MKLQHKIKNIGMIILILNISMFSDSCKSKKAQTTIEDTSKYQNYTKGTISRNTFDGCSWLIILEDGKKLEPVNLTDEFKSDNLKIWLQYKNYAGMSICMMGQMISITAIEKR